METSIILGILSLFGSLAGTFGGIMTANRLTGYRIDQLEKKVENLESEVKQSNTQFIAVSKDISHLADNDVLLDEKIKVANARILDLENANKK